MALYPETKGLALEDMDTLFGKSMRISANMSLTGVTAGSDGQEDPAVNGRLGADASPDEEDSGDALREREDEPLLG